MKKGSRTAWVFCIASALVLTFALFVGPVTTWAQTEGTDTGTTVTGGDEGSTDGDEGNGDEVPAFNNPAQAQHAENIAEAAATEPSTEYLEALDALAQAQEALDAANDSGDEDAIAEAQDTYDAADALVEELAAQNTGVSVETIAAMRADGMGWGEICHELGVHPSVLGLGHKKKMKKMTEYSEMNEATARNTKTGLAIGHGAGTDTGKGFALGHSKKGGDKGGKGVGGQSSGNSGGQGKGHGGGQGKGHGGGKKK